MPSPFPRRFLPLVLAAPLACALPATAADARPNTSTVQSIALREYAPRLTVPHRRVVSGAITFGATHIAAGAREVIFLVDGRARWSTTHAPFRFRHTGLLNTAHLKAGRHTLAVEVVFGKRRRRTARTTIIVKHARVKRPVASATSATAHITSVAKRTPKHTPAPAPVSSPTPSPTPTGAPTSGSATSSSPVSGTPAAGAPGATGASVAQWFRTDYGFSTQLPIQQEANRYQVLVLQSTDYAEVPVLKAANPNLKVFMYQSPGHSVGANPPDNPTATGCTSAADDLANHPNWILHDSTGAIVHSPDDATNYVMDMGNTAYQTKCVANGIALAKRLGFDGVFWDELNGVLAWNLAHGQTVPEYPNDTLWASGVGAFIQLAAAQCRQAGLLTIGNIAGAPDTTTWENWVSQLDGVEEESWTDGGIGPSAQLWYFQQKLDELAWTQTHGKYELDHSWSATEQGNTYGIAAMLLAAGGTASYGTANTDYSTQEAWYPEYTTAQALGAPTGPYTHLANGVLERSFANGIVLVNASNNTVPSFSLGGTYSGSGLTKASTVSMAPTTGLVLLKS